MALFSDGTHKVQFTCQKDYYFLKFDIRNNADYAEVMLSGLSQLVFKIFNKEPALQTGDVGFERSRNIESSMEIVGSCVFAV